MFALKRHPPKPTLVDSFDFDPLPVMSEPDIYPMMQSVRITPDQCLHGEIILMRDVFVPELGRPVPTEAGNGRWSFSFDADEVLALDGSPMRIYGGQVATPEGWADRISDELHNICQPTFKRAWLTRDDGPVLVGPSLCGSAGVCSVLHLTGSRRREVAYVPTAAIIDHPPIRISERMAAFLLQQADDELASLATWQYWGMRTACLLLWIDKRTPTDMRGLLPLTGWGEGACPDNGNAIPGATIPASHVSLYSEVLRHTTPQALRDVNGNVVLSRPSERVVYVGHERDAVVREHLASIGKKRLRLFAGGGRE